VRVLVVRFGALGDVVLTTPLLRAIRGASLDVAITVVTRSEWAPVLRHHPSVDTVESFDRGERVRELARRLRPVAWDHRIDLHGSLRSRMLRMLVGGRWGTWRKPRLRRARQTWAGVTHPPLPPVAEQYFAAAAALGVSPDGRGPDVVPAPADEAAAAALAPPGRFVALAPGAAHATKRWPGPHWTRLAERLARRGVTTVVVGTAADGARVTAPSATDRCGIGLGPTAALLRRAAVVVANDSGLMHLATAVDTPVVALFGPTTPTLGYAPYRSRAIVLEHPLPCRPCSVYGTAHCPMRHHRCMIDLTPEEVANAVLDAMA
jgi:heptosyltransferase-2